MKLSRALKLKRNELIGELATTHPGRGYVWAVQEGCRIVREAVAEAAGAAPPAPALTAADFAAMPAEELAARIFRT